MHTPLDVLADLELTVDGERIDIRGDGDRIIADMPSLTAARTVFLKSPLGGTTRRAAAERVHQWLKSADLTLDITYNHRRVARLGARAHPNAVSRLLDLPSVEVTPAAPVREAATRNPLVTAVLLLTGIGVLIWLWQRSD